MADAKSEPAAQVAAARKGVEAARTAVETELDNLGSAARAAVDIPAKIRRNPVRTAGLAGGAVFLLAGGPRRVGKGVEKRLFPKRYSRPPKVLPKKVEEAVGRLPEEDQELVRAHLERDFAAYLKAEHAKDPPNARTSAWKTYNLLLATIGARAARELVKKLFEVPPQRPEE